MQLFRGFIIVQPDSWNVHPLHASDDFEKWLNGVLWLLEIPSLRVDIFNCSLNMRWNMADLFEVTGTVFKIIKFLGSSENLAF